MDWSTKRKLVYALVVIMFTATGTVFVLRDTLFPEPTCSDLKKNGFELDVDCGGLCDKKCTQEVVPLVALWAKAVEVGSSTYDVAGMVSNSNIDNASRALGYSFTIFNTQGGIITVLNGTTTAPLDGKFPLILQNIPLSEKPESVTLTLFDTDHYKVRESPTSPTVSITNREFEEGVYPRLYATVANNKRIEIRNLEVRAVLFDSHDNAYAVGKTVVPLIGKEGKEQIVFTWPSPLKEVPTRIGVYPIFNPFEALAE